MAGGLSRLPLRVTIAGAMVVLLALGLTAAAAAATLALRSYMLNRVDVELIDTARDFAAGPPRGDPRGFGRGDRDGDRPGERRGPTEYFIRYTSPDGSQWIDVSRPDGTSAEFPVWPQADAPPPDTPTTVDLGGTEWRVVTERLEGGLGYVLVATPLSGIQAILGRLILLQGVIGILVIVAGAALGYALVRWTLRPLAQVEATAGVIAATADDGGLRQRVPGAESRSEAGRLAASFNAMIDRIEGAFSEREASEAAAIASEERMRRFIADASHELRTPLTTIRGFAELYRQGAVPSEDVPRTMERIEGEAQRMGVLVEDLLLLARLDQHRPIEFAPVDLLDLTTEAITGAHAAYPWRAISLTSQVDPAAPVIDGDRMRLRQVLDNLIANAVQHTAEQSSIRVGLDTEQPGWARLTVADDGPGMSPDQAARVFERFYRVDESRNRESGGAGLGLAIVRSLVIAHGGSVDVTSAPEAGTTFTVRLPLTGSSQAGPRVGSGDPATMES